MISYAHIYRTSLFLLSILILAGCGRLAASEPAAQATVVSSAPDTIQGETTGPTPANAAQGPAATATQPVVAQAPPNPVSGLAAFPNDLPKNETFRGAVLIARNGEILLSQGYGLADSEQNIPNTPQTKFRLGSLTKQFTALAILILQAQGKLNVQDSICSYLVDCPATWQAITIHHLLSHTSGISDFSAFPDFESTKATPSPPERTIARFKDKPLEFQPGQNWRYSNSGYILLGQIIEAASGRSYEDFLQQHIFTPLEMKNTGYDHNQSDLAIGYRFEARADIIDMSIPYAAGGLYASVEDLYQWAQALYTGQLISQELLDQMFTVRAAIPGANGAGYGYGWIIEQRFGHRVYAHNGSIEGFATSIALFPDDKLTIIVLSNQQNVNPGFINSWLARKVLGAE